MKITVKESKMLDEQDVLRWFKNNFDEVELLPGSDRCDFWVKLPDNVDRGKVKALCRDIEQASASRIWNNSFIKEYGSILVGFKDLTDEPEKLLERNTIDSTKKNPDNEGQVMNENTKITLTIGQLKKLVRESASEADIMDYIQTMAGKIDYNQMVEDLMEEFGISENEAQGYIDKSNLDDSQRFDEAGTYLDRAKAKLSKAIDKFNETRKQALAKIGDEDSLYYETGSTIQGCPSYISELKLEYDSAVSVKIIWEEEENIGWKTRRTPQELVVNLSDDYDIDTALDNIRYLTKGVKKALKYYEKVNPDNEEEVIADLEKDEADEATELTVKEGTGEPSDELLISEFTAEWVASGLNNLDNMMDCMERGADSDKRKCWMRLGRRLREIADMCDENARRVWKR